MKDKLAIIILNWNGRKWLEKFLPSVVAHSDLSNVKIYVADNQSTDDSIAFMEQHYPGIQLLKNHENNGYAGGYNFAIEQVSESLICLLNSDIEVTEHWLEPILQQFENDLKIGAIQPKILSYHDKTHFEYAGAGGGCIDYLGYPFCRGRIFDTIEKDEGQYDDITEVFWASGACLFVRRSIYLELGGLDTDFFAHQEEIDMCWRMKNAGHSIFYNGKSTVYHVGGGSLPYGNSKKTFLNFRNNLYMIVKNNSVGRLLWLIPVRLVLDGLAAVHSVVKSKKMSDMMAILKAHFSFYSNFFKIISKRDNSPKSIHNAHSKSIIFQYFILKKRIFKFL